ncbi:MAG: TIGR00296 family protein [Methanomicrobiales archaeon HGW-Methanomicrobiales-1]|nr:MAG: TIGR00296 family protein [Methanomicrobiales archaeon HGW-Methanomicrobiales-1]
MLTADEGTLAIHLARGALEQAVAKKPVPVLKLTQVFHDKRGVFVTLTRDDELRGCIGLPYPVMSLGAAIEHAAKAAALEDPRFPPVAKDELAHIDLEVTVLTVPVPLLCEPSERPANVKVGKHGLIIRGMGTSGLLLPQVATDYGWDSTTFLDHTCTKAGLPGRCWTRKDVEVMIFEGQIFSETRNRLTS